VGHALPGLCAQGAQFRSGRHQCLECQVAALAALARCRRRSTKRRARNIPSS
jgi:hypothetical protein